MTPVPSVGKGTVGIYPNPAVGPTVEILPAPYEGFLNVRVEVFTVNFRKVKDETFYSIPSGTPVTLVLSNSWGNRLANGLYYVVVTSKAGRATGKLLVLR